MTSYGARRLAALVTSTLVVAGASSVATGGTAWADSSNGQGQTQSQGQGQDTAPGQQKQDTGTSQQPQPESTADQNAGGANNGGDCGSYCSTTDGTASQNGNVDTQTSGKPCAGCVGRADDKNPPGQRPDGSDNNAGYECDRNSGVGVGNPAHSSCTPSELAPQPSTALAVEGERAQLASASPLLFGSSAAGASVLGAALIGAAPTSVPGAQVLGERAVADRTAATTPSSAVGAASARLPFTGATIGLDVAVALAAIALGWGATLVGRRRRHSVQ